MSDAQRDVSLAQVMESVDESRRAVLKRLLAGSAIVAVPLITALVGSDKAEAQVVKGKFKGAGKGKGKP
jgi:hypothetical protein